MKNEKESVYNFKQRVLSGVTALGLFVGGYFLSTPTNAYASASDHKFGIYYDAGLDYEFNSYVVEENDLTASNVSTKIVNYFLRKKEVPQEFREVLKENPDASCRFWPVVAYIYELTKNKSYHTRPGEKIYFPKTFDEMVALNTELKKNGWFAKYCKKHNIYPKKKTVYLDKEYARSEIIKILAYTSHGDTICADDDTIAAYLKTLGDAMNVKYVYKEGAKLTKGQDWAFHEWLLTPEEIIYPGTKQKTKTK